MRNVECVVSGKTLTITVDLSKRQGRSKSGKTEIIASTDGNAAVADGSGGTVCVGLNVYTK